MSLLGENFVKLQGDITRKKVTKYENGGIMFKCNLAIPVPGIEGKYQYMGVSVWGDMAEQLEEIKEGTNIKVLGHLEKHSFNSKCNYCNGPTTIYWTNVAIDNFVVTGE